MKKNIGILLILLITSLNLHASRGFLNCLKNDVDLKKSVIIFYSPDCRYCSKMEKEIAKNEKFQELLKSKYNIQIINIKTDEGKKIAALYKVKAVPTIVNYDQTSLVIKKSKGFGSINKLSSFLNLNRNAKTNIGDFSLSVCGDGVLDEGEACDDGNTTDGDGCSSACELESLCGNGVLDGNEVCDDGNTLDGDNCSSTCDAVYFCGDGILEGNEACDDGNTTDGDGCSSTCELESVCGNGVLDAGEACDDGNNIDGDGCSSVCEDESLAVNEYGIAFTELKSYPVPFKNKLTVSLYLLHNSDVELLVYDITGKQVHAKTIDNVSFGKNEIVFGDIQFLQSGNYLLKINVTNQLGTYFKVSNILKK
jgi:cysteine-rich repeat protein